MRSGPGASGHRDVLSIIAAALLVLATLLGVPAGGKGAEFSVAAAEELQPLHIWEETDAAGRTWIKAEFRVAAPPSAVFAVLLDAELFPEFMSEVREARVLEAGEGFQVVRFRVVSGVLESRYIVKRVFNSGEGRIIWHLVEGRPRALEGAWKIDPTPDGEGSLVRYAAYVDPGSWVPESIVRHFQRRTVSEMIASLQRRVLSGGRSGLQE